MLIADVVRRWWLPLLAAALVVSGAVMMFVAMVIPGPEVVVGSTDYAYAMGSSPFEDLIQGGVVFLRDVGGQLLWGVPYTDGLPFPALRVGVILVVLGAALASIAGFVSLRRRAVDVPNGAATRRWWLPLVAVALVVTGVALTVIEFGAPEVEYEGTYLPLKGIEMSEVASATLITIEPRYDAAGWLELVGASSLALGLILGTIAGIIGLRRRDAR